MTEVKALRQLQKGSTDALEWFIRKYTPYVSTVIYNIIGSTMDMTDVEEVASDVFYILWDKAETVRPDSVRGFLGCVARNKAKNKLREVGCAVPLDEELLIVEGTPLEERCYEESLRMAVRREVMALTEPDREIVLRYYYYFQPIAEIAAEVGMSESNVKVRLHRVRKVLRQSLSAIISD